MIEGLILELVCFIFISTSFVCCTLGFEDLRQLCEVVLFLLTPVLGIGLDFVVGVRFQCVVDPICYFLRQNLVADELHGLATETLATTNDLRAISCYLIV
ncbi:hypothetical protein D3C81_2145040 [compost metagenome]